MGRKVWVDEARDWGGIFSGEDSGRRDVGVCGCRGRGKRKRIGCVCRDGESFANGREGDGDGGRGG